MADLFNSFAMLDLLGGQPLSMMRSEVDARLRERTDLMAAAARGDARAMDLVRAAANRGAPSARAFLASRAVGQGGRAPLIATAFRAPSRVASPGRPASPPVASRSPRPIDAAEEARIAAYRTRAKIEVDRRARLSAEVRGRSGVGTVPIAGEIASDDAPALRDGRFVVRPKDVIQQCEDLRAVGAKAAIVAISSQGGEVAAGLAMVRALEALSGAGIPTVAHVRNRAESMAAIVAAAADYAVVDPFANLLVHALSGGTDEGRAILTSRVRGILGERTLLPEPVIDGMTDAGAGADFRFTAYEAVTHGLADEVGGPERTEEIARELAAGRPWVLVARSARRSALSARVAVSLT